MLRFSDLVYLTKFLPQFLTRRFNQVHNATGPVSTKMGDRLQVQFPVPYRDLFRYLTNQPPKANSAFHPSGVGKWASFGWEGKGRYCSFR